MRPISIKEKAAELRKLGYSYTYISKQVGVSKSTLSDWLTHIPYVPNKEMVESYGKARSAASLKKAEIKRTQLGTIKTLAKEKVGKISSRDLFLFGLALYLGEGSKLDGITRVTNSDPRIIKASIQWFRSLGVKDSQFKCRIHLYPDSEVLTCEHYWMKVTGLKRENFYNPSVDRRLGKKKENSRKLPYGTLHLSVNSRGEKEFGVLFSRSIAAWSQEALDQIEAGLV